MDLLIKEGSMDPIDIESSNKNSEEIVTGVPLQSIHYKDIGLTYKFIDDAGETWFHQIVGEWMLGVRTRQFDYYCKNMVPPVIKRREQTSRYSYNFVKESDIHRIAQAKGKVLRMPLQDIPTTDSNEKIFSKTDLEAGYKKAVNELAIAEFKNYDLRIHDLETKNDHLNTEVNRLTIEKAEIIESKSKETLQIAGEKQEIIDKKTVENNLLAQKVEKEEREKIAALNKKRNSIVLAVVIGVVAAAYGFITYKDNDRLYDEKKSLNNQMATLHEGFSKISSENSNLKLKTKMQDDEIEILKKQVPVTQNAEINAVKKD
jgi:hypothetical protein